MRSCPVPTLLDDCLPRPHFRGVASMRVHASPAAILRAFRRVEMPLASLVVRSEPRPMLDELRTKMNAVVAERPEREIVVAMVGRLHRLGDRRPLRRRASFFTFAEPSHEKLAMSLRVVEEEGASRIVFEHRTEALDSAAWWKFGLCWWLLLKWCSLLMAWLLLRAVKRRAEAEEETSDVTLRASWART